MNAELTKTTMVTKDEINELREAARAAKKAYVADGTISLHAAYATFDIYIEAMTAYIKANKLKVSPPSRTAILRGSRF